jgi:hypothetical protein
MAARSIEQSSTAELTEQEKFSINFEAILRTAEIMKTRTNEMRKLRQELKSNMEKLRSMQSEINTIAIKYGVEPISAYGMQFPIELSDGISISVPLSAPE